MNDLPVFDLAGMLRFARNEPEVQRGDRIIFRAFVSFLQDQKLLSQKEFPTTGDLPDESRIMESDLSEEGKRLFRNQVIDKWLGSIDRSGRYTDVTILEKGLKKIRVNKP